MSPARILALGIVFIASAGCAHNSPDSEWRCRLNETPSLPYAPMSRTFQVDNLPDSTVVAAHMYSLYSTRSEVMPCSNLAIVKEIHIRAAPGKNLRLREHRKLIDARGRTLQENEEDISQQITVSATYRGILALTIPAETKPGTYRLVSTVYVDGLADEPVALNQASTRFTVMASGQALTPAPKATRPRQDQAARNTISKNRAP